MKIGFLGLGQMGGALMIAFTKFLQKQKLNEENIKNIFYLFDPQRCKQEEYMSYGFKNIANSEKDVFQNSKLIFICVKPDSVKELLEENLSYIGEDHVLISICAGISIDFIENSFQGRNKIPKIIRIMANHLCIINESSSTYCTNSRCTVREENIINILLQNVGLIKKVPESKMNVYTALAGSGPAFIYYFADCIIDAALKNGIDINTAREYSINVLYGAAKYLKNSPDKNPNNLKYIITTPNGTTIHGLSQLDKHGFKYALNEALTASAERSAEIEREKLKLWVKPKF